MENSKIKSVFALGPAPPGHRPPNTSLFTRLESHLLSMSHRMKHTTARIERLRGAHRLETCTAMRLTIKDQVVKAIKDQIQARELMAKYSLKLKALQEAEILKVVRHMRGIDKISEEKSNALALLRVKIKQEPDPAKVRFLQQDIYALIKWQEKTRDLRERWRLRLVQMEAYKVKVLKPPTSSKPVNASRKISSPKSKTETKSINKATMENIGKNVSTPKPKTEATHQENINKKISTPKSKTATKCIPKPVALKSKKKIDQRKDNIGCKRCAFLQRANKNKNNFPKVCKVCLKWAHKVIQNGIEIDPNRSTLKNNTTVSKSAITPTEEQELNTDIESMIKMEIEPVTDFGMMEENITPKDPPKPSSNIEIEPLDASMNDEIMSDVIKEEETENFAKTEFVDFEEVIVIQDKLKAIEDKNTALAHVRILQEYAMLNDNYRAIGLLSEVEAALTNPPKNEDFEC